MPTCAKCNEKFPARISIDGKVRFIQKRKYCLKCSPFGLHNTRKIHLSIKKKWQKQKEWQFRERKKRRSILIKMRGGCCKICGYDTCDASLDFHHVNKQDKLFCLGAENMTRFSLERLINEASKTVLLCRNHHGEVESGLWQELEEQWRLELKE